MAQSRWWLLRVLGRIILAPFFFVNFADFWLGDQLCSMTTPILDLYYLFCYLGYGGSVGQMIRFQIFVWISEYISLFNQNYVSMNQNRYSNPLPYLLRFSRHRVGSARRPSMEYARCWVLSPSGSDYCSVYDDTVTRKTKCSSTMPANTAVACSSSCFRP